MTAIEKIYKPAYEGVTGRPKHWKRTGGGPGALLSALAAAAVAAGVAYLVLLCYRKILNERGRRSYFAERNGRMKGRRLAEGASDSSSFCGTNGPKPPCNSNPCVVSGPNGPSDEIETLSEGGDGTGREEDAGSLTSPGVQSRLLKRFCFLDLVSPTTQLVLALVFVTVTLFGGIVLIGVDDTITKAFGGTMVVVALLVSLASVTGMCLALRPRLRDLSSLFLNAVWKRPDRTTNTIV